MKNLFKIITFSTLTIALSQATTTSTKCTGANEIYKQCGTRCPPTCTNRNPICTKECVSGCFCKDGYIRQNGKCILISQCPLVCGPNEEIASCPPACPPERSCDQEFKGYEYSCAPPPPDFVCSPACRCKPGFIRNDKKQCVKLENCCADPNAEVVDCPNPCPSTCESFGNMCTVECQRKGCQCKQGYILHKGKCIKYNQCPKPLCTKKNEVFSSCRNPCPETCDSYLGLGPQVLCLPPYPCPGGCNCRPGYVRDKNNNCILPEKCVLECKGANQTLNKCPAYCTFVDDCSSYISGIIRDCAAPPPDYKCRPRCECTPGNILVFGECKHPNECCQQHASVVDCPNPCPRTCENLLQENIICSKLCLFRGCQCNDGYVLDSRSQCIKPEECPPLDCPANEHYEKCPDRCYKDPTCESYIDGIVEPCLPPDIPTPCAPKCVCNEGLVRINGTCVSPDACCLGANQAVVSCPDPCPPSCANLLQPPRPCGRLCRIRGCACKDGFVRDDNLNCVKPEDCPPLPCPKNEHYNNCPGYCTFDPDCASYVDGIIRDCAAPPEGGVPCAPRCECNEGLLRINGTCLSSDFCCPGPNEEVVDCPNPCPLSCDNPTGQVPCPRMCIRRGCQCKKGYVRDKNFKCIKLEQCPKKCTKPNEVYQARGTKCQPTCDDRSPVCTKNLVPGCFCKPGYIREVTGGKCIKVGDCPETCGQ